MVMVVMMMTAVGESFIRIVVAAGLVIFGCRVYDIFITIVLLVSALVAFVHKLTLPFTLIGVFFLYAQDHLLADDCVEDECLLCRDRVPVLNLSGVYRTSTFTYRQNDNRLRILSIVFLRLRNGSNSSGPKLVFKRMVTSRKLDFDLVCLKPEAGPNNQRFSSTMNFKQTLLEDLVLTYKQADEIRIYEDRVKQLVNMIPS